MPDPLYLGLDSSTQSLSAILLDPAAREVVWQHSFAFDEALPQYRTRHGVIPSVDPRVAHSSPRMWAEALDRMLATLAADRTVDQSRLSAISGSAQQHGSVYLTDRWLPRLTALDHDIPLVHQLDGVFARDESPIWMDSSTTAQCEEIERAVGGAPALATLTGSRAFERFTGPQIRKFWQQDAAAYTRTSQIHLVSSFLASLLAGTAAPLEPGDASGMNLMDLATLDWSPQALQATAPALSGKLPRIVEPWTVIGALSPYWTRRHGLPAARVVAWTGDNPSSLIGTGLVREGQIAVSLGTSDTIFGPMAAPRVDASGTGHVFGAPTGRFMGITVFKNGSLARERIRDRYGLDWEGFSRALRETPPGNRGALMLPWFAPEITPRVLTPGVHRRGLDEDDAAANVRAVVEAQMLSMSRHARWMGVAIETIHATGGAAANRDVLQVMADVFGATVSPFQVGNSACLGAALRAWHANRLADGDPVSWDDVAAIVEPFGGSSVSPRPQFRETYADLAAAQAEFENRC